MDGRPSPLGDFGRHLAGGGLVIRFNLSALFLAILLAAFTIKIAPQIFDRLKEPDGMKTKGSGTYVWLDHTRATMSDRELDFRTFQPNSKPGNLILIKHTCELFDPEIFGGFATRKILIQLPSSVNEGHEFAIAVQATSRLGLRPARLNSEVPDGMACVFFSNDGGHYWLSDIQTPASGTLKIGKMTNQSVTIDLELPDDVMMKPATGSIPQTLDLARRTPIVR